MKNWVMIAALLAGCGYSEKGNKVVGQPTKVRHVTPIFCSDYTEVEIKFGLMQTGVGAAGVETATLYVEDAAHVAVLEAAAQTGSLVEYTYQKARKNWCVPEREITDVKLMPRTSLAAPVIIGGAP